MKQIVIISGKGGTGKTVVAASFAALVKNKVMADCDVDAPNLHLILKPEILESHPFPSGFEVIKDESKCNQCGKCQKVCRFNAISDDFVIDSVACEACGVCVEVCPQQALRLVPKVSGTTYLSRTKYGPFSHAKLGIAEENSGKLVSEVRKNAVKMAEEGNKDLIIIDGPPGIGCPVIASVTGANLALIVTEPTLSGIWDLERALELTRHFQIKTLVCINKYDLNLKNSKNIEKFCKESRIEIAGRIPFDSQVTKAMVQGKSIMEYPGSPPAKEIEEMWERVRRE
ncbi:Iron-sulfur cluster carrier protein [subsurface metagenome]